MQRTSPGQTAKFSKFQEGFRSNLSKMGGRFTKTRRNILRIVSNKKGHFSAEDIHAELRDRGASASLASVYRTLPLLVECGIIRRTSISEETASGGNVYETIAHRTHHDHLVCTACGARVEFVYEAIEVLQEAVARQHGFELTGHNLELVGVCGQCRTEDEGPKR